VPRDDPQRLDGCGAVAVVAAKPRVDRVPEFDLVPDQIGEDQLDVDDTHPTFILTIYLPWNLLGSREERNPASVAP
jgi:hypothetical protein